MTVPPRSSYRVLIVDDHALFAESLELAITMEGYDVKRLEVPRDGASSATLLSSILRLRPRVVLLDLDLGPLTDGAALIGPIVRSGTHVVVVTASADRARWGQCLRHGARKVIAKARGLNEILSTVRRLHQGLPVMDREERDDLLRLWHQQRSEQGDLHCRIQRLTVRERAVLGQLMLGHTVRDIAKSHVVSEATVRTQVKSILAKLEVSSQLAAVGLAHRAGWHPPEL